MLFLSCVVLWNRIPIRLSGGPCPNVPQMEKKPETVKERAASDFLSLHLPVKWGQEHTTTRPAAYTTPLSFFRQHCVTECKKKWRVFLVIIVMDIIHYIRHAYSSLRYSVLSLILIFFSCQATELHRVDNAKLIYKTQHSICLSN